jgi:tetratricopeptide (TPR) repeat protein
MGMQKILLVLLIVAALTTGATALENDPRLREARQALAAGESQRAVEILMTLTKDQPTLLDGWLDLGRSHSARKEWEAALSAYQRVLNLRPDHARTVNNIGNVHFRQNHFEKASEWYVRALELQPDYLNALFHDGWVLRHLNRLDAAESRFRACLAVEAANDRERKMQVDCMFFLGAIHSRRENFEQTVSFMEQVLAIFPTHGEARYYLGTAYRQLGRLDEARAQLEWHNAQREAARRGKPIARNPEP